MKKILLALSFGLILALAAAPAQATPLTSWTGYFTEDFSSTGLGTPDFGEVVLTKDGADVDFTVTLYDGSKFVRTGAGDGMVFMFNGDDFGVGDISGTGLTAATGTFGNGASGAFEFGVYFTGQGNGGNSTNAKPGPLVFTVQGTTIEDLIQPNNKQVIFAADILSGQNRLTGLVGVVTEGTPNVPEPSTMVLLGLGLVGLAAVRKFNK